MNSSRSEDNGIELLTNDDNLIYSIGVSTGGLAEIRMVTDYPERHVIATTIDEQGLKDAELDILKKGLEKQVELRIEDVSQGLPYGNDYFDFIYARLVLHYLSKNELKTTLQEIRRILKPGKIFYVVVRSSDTKDAINAVKRDDETGFSYYYHAGDDRTPLIKRYFHSEDSISEALSGAGFKVEKAESYDERLFVDFMRTVPSPHLDRLIEVRARK